VGTLNLLDAMRKHGHDRLVFSSTAATYGVPTTNLIDESHACAPINPYGRSKLMVEQALRDHADAYGLRSVSFRYFNACGAHPIAPIGERHEPETHLIPNILLSLLDGGRALRVFGDDYDTPDGSCVRDYVHVGDLCNAHLAAANYLGDHEGAAIMNLGNGNGFSVFKVIDAVKRVTGRNVEFEVVARRPGDPPVLVADSSRARCALGWSPRYATMDEIIQTAWNFHASRRG
jgi:UDP-glucose 4-epimerase